MRISKTGEISDSFYVVGSYQVPVYLLDGPVPVLFDAGFSALAPLYLRDIKKILGDRTPALLLLTHAHFDHIGAAGYFKRAWPEMQIAGSAKTREILNSSGAIQLIRKLNDEGAAALKRWGIYPPEKASFETFKLDNILSNGTRLENRSACPIEVIHSPGHTWDFLSFWLPEKKILIASEAAGCDDGNGHIVSEFLVDYDTYVKSLKNLARLDCEILCPGHRVVLTGADVKEYFSRSLNEALTYAEMVEMLLQEEKEDVEKVIWRVKKIEWDPNPFPKQPEPAYLLNTRARVRNILDRMKRKISEKEVQEMTIQE
ncbi:MAG: MBL fold metallo-hydrolase [Deltaproteobacteria bacterium]|nr:MBL fold metallo-hydrolase [Deltaproteobacteria bacterium]